MNDLSWTQFTKKIYINTSLDKMYWCWATKEGITTWFLKDANFVRNGKPLNESDFLKANDGYTWFWHNWDGQEDGKILEANGKDCIRFTFAGDCEVEITMKQTEKAILLTLKQSKIPIDEKSKLQIFYGCSNGWTFWLTNLKSYLEYGILLNETEFDLSSFNLAEFQFVNM